VFFDFGTGWTSCHPVTTRSELDTKLAFREFIGPKDKVYSFYSDGAPEIVACAKALELYGDTSTQGIPRNNSIAENKVKLVINGSRCLLLQAGLPSKFWPYATQAFCNGINTVVKNGESCYNKRHKQGHFLGKYIPFGCLVDYYPTKRTYLKGSSKSKDIPDEGEDSSDDEDEDKHENVEQENTKVIEGEEKIDATLALDISEG